MSPDDCPKCPEAAECAKRPLAVCDLWWEQAENLGESQVPLSATRTGENREGHH